MITALSTLIIIGGIFVYLVAGYVICFFLNNHKLIDICKSDFNGSEPDEGMLLFSAIFFPLVLGYVIIKKSSYFIINLFIE